MANATDCAVSALPAENAVPHESPTRDALPQAAYTRALVLQAQLAEIEVQNLHLKIEVEALRAATDSRGFRILMKLYGVRLLLMPKGSWREYLGVGSLVALSYAGQKLIATARALAYRLKLARRAPRSSESVVISFTAPASPEAATSLCPRHDTLSVATPVVAAATGASYYPDDDVRNSFATVPYIPLSWQVKAAPPSDNPFINLIVLSAVGRSGSTLLQRICNSRKGTLIWGEHQGVIGHFAEIYKRIADTSMRCSKEREQYFTRGEVPNLWIANLMPELDYAKQATVESVRALLNTLYGQYSGSHDIVGFKEVSYGRADVELLRKCYPEADILLLVRHPCNTWNSTPREWFASAAAFADCWTARVEDFSVLAKSDPKCRLIRHEDVVAQENRTVDILIDVAKVSREQISAVLAHKIGSSHKGIDDAERRTILDRCREQMESLGYR